MTSNEVSNGAETMTTRDQLLRALRGMRVGLALLVIGLIPVMIDPDWIVFAFIPLFMGVCLGLFGLWIVSQVSWQMKLWMSLLLIAVVCLGVLIGRAL